MRPLVAFLLMMASGLSAHAAPPIALQPLIDAAAPGDVVRLPAGVYAGPVLIDKPLVLDGNGAAVVTGGGTGTIISIKTNGATIQGLRLENSGSSHNDLDAGVHVEGNNNVIRDNVIVDCLFGIDLQQANDNMVLRNTIESKPRDLGVRGDSIRLWYSYRNHVEENVVHNSRDMVVWYSSDNIIARNTVRGGRYALHFMYSKKNWVTQNIYEDNSVGVFLMYSDGVELRGNRIAFNRGPTSMGIGLKESSQVVIADNRIIYCSTGIYLDVSPYQPDTTNRLERNHLDYNAVGILFLSDWSGNEIEGNVFNGNIRQVAVQGRASAQRNRWDGNFWDDYVGFDQDRNGIGDRPYELQAYAGRLWADSPNAGFFRGSPLLGLLDFLAELAPFSEPVLVLRDDRPHMTADVPAPPSSSNEDSGRIDPFGLKERLGRP